MGRAGMRDGKGDGGKLWIWQELKAAEVYKRGRSKKCVRVLRNDK